VAGHVSSAGEGQGRREERGGAGRTKGGERKREMIEEKVEEWKRRNWRRRE
jgi:hypothetical protein